LIGLEACSGAPFSWTRVESTGPRCSIDFRSVGEALLKSNQNYYLDAEAIAKAVDRKNMRFVAI
jgi:transposase